MDLIKLMILDMPVSDRIKKALIKNGIVTIEDLKSKTLKEISSLRGIGKDSMTELMFFLKNANIKLKTEGKKPVKKDYLFEQAKEIIEIHLTGRSFNWKNEIPLAKRLIKVYSFELMKEVKLPAHVNSFRWLVSGIGAWADSYVAKFAKPEIVVKEEEEKQEKKIINEGELIEFRKIESKPLSLKEFLGFKRR